MTFLLGIGGSISTTVLLALGVLVSSSNTAITLAVIAAVGFLVSIGVLFGAMSYIRITAQSVTDARGMVCVRCLHPINIEQHRRDDPCPERGEPNSKDMPDMWFRAIRRWGSRAW